MFKKYEFLKSALNMYTFDTTFCRTLYNSGLMTPLLPGETVNALISCHIPTVAMLQALCLLLDNR